jgi:hypothetical protein
MIHDTELLDKLDSFPKESFEGKVFRATRLSLDPLLASRSGGRWMPPGVASVLYTSLDPDGAMAEIAFHWAQFTPKPSKLAALHTLQVAADRTLRLVRADIEALGVPKSDYGIPNNLRTQEIGAAVEFLGCDGIVAPCARWSCDNLILFPDRASFAGSLDVISSDEVDWIAWSETHSSSR